MILKFAIWENGPAAYLREEHLSVFEGKFGAGIQGGSFLRLAVGRTGQVWLSATTEENAARLSKSPETSSGAGWPYRIIGTRGSADEYPARCGPMDLSFQWELGYALIANLPEMHELPWPWYHEHEQGPFDKHEAAVREIRVRMDSMRRHGGGLMKVPKHIQLLLTPEERVRLFSEQEI